MTFGRQVMYWVLVMVNWWLLTFPAIIRIRIHTLEGTFK
jgi:hypothetical protein